MQLINKFDKEFHFLLCVIDVYNRYVSILLLKDKKGITITSAFQKHFDESNCKSNKIWVQDNDIEMYLPRNEGTFVVAERFIRTLKNKIYKYMNSVSKICILINEMI